jgi:hypothetical protein
MKRGKNYLLHVNAVAGAAEDQASLHRSRESLGLVRVSTSPSSLFLMTYLIRNLFLLLAWKIDEVVILCANQERDGGLVEASPLTVPFLNGVERALASQIEHE